MNKGAEKETTRRFDRWVIAKLIVFVVLSAAASAPLRAFVEAVIEGKKGAPDFVTPAFLIYGFASRLVFGIGYMILGCRLPVKNTVLRGFCYIMLILVSSYLPNVLGMAGGDGEIISDALSVWIVIVDVLLYALQGLILGLLMKKYAGQKPEPASHIKGGKFILLCGVNGVLFAALNILTDILAGSCEDSWRLCAILKVSAQRETAFYIVFAVFMFAAGCLLPLWYKFCLPDDVTISGAVLFALKLSVIAWLPNVLIMAFFGTPVLLTAAYGAAYLLMIIVCVVVYTMLNRAWKQKQVSAVQC